MKTYKEKMDALHASDALKDRTVTAMLEAQRSERPVASKHLKSLWRIAVPVAIATCTLTLAFVPHASNINYNSFSHWQDPRMTVSRTQANATSEQATLYNTLTAQTLNGKERTDFVFQPLTLANGRETWFVQADYGSELRWFISDFAVAFWSTAETYKPTEYEKFSVYFMQDSDRFYAFWQQAELYQTIEGTTGTTVQQSVQAAIKLLS